MNPPHYTTGKKITKSQEALIDGADRHIFRITVPFVLFLKSSLYWSLISLSLVEDGIYDGGLKPIKGFCCLPGYLLCMQEGHGSIDLFIFLLLIFDYRGVSATETRRYRENYFSSPTSF